jgi:hypothetical protein
MSLLPTPLLPQSAAPLLLPVVVREFIRSIDRSIVDRV